LKLLHVIYTFVYFSPENKGFCDYTTKQILFRLFCGGSLGSQQEEEVMSEEKVAMEHHLSELAQLKQTRGERIVLGIGLVLILAIGTALYVFWSTYRFEHGEFYPGTINSTAGFTLLPGDEPVAEAQIEMNKK
jgi:hypothetical protein